MVCNCCVHFLQKFRPAGLPKDDLFIDVEGTKLRVTCDYQIICHPIDRTLCSHRVVVYKLRLSPMVSVIIQTKSRVN